MGTLLIFLLATAVAFGQLNADYPTQVQRKPALDPREFTFSYVSGATPTRVTVDLSAAGAKTATLTPCPKGVAGANTNHRLYISGGTGTAEDVLITGGTCTSGAATGTLAFTTANTHTGSWSLRSATAGLQEMYYMMDTTGGEGALPCGDYDLYGVLTLGNGSAGGSSTRQNVSLVGKGGGSSSSEYLTVGCVRLKWMGTAGAATMVQINGPIGRVRIEGILFDARPATTSAVSCLTIAHAYSSIFKDLHCDGGSGYGFVITAYDSVAGIAIGANDNIWENIKTSSDTVTTSSGIQIGGTTYGSAPHLDVAKNTFTNIGLSPGTAGVGVNLRFTDALNFNLLVINAGATGILVSPPTGATQFPQGISCYNCVFITTTAIVSTGWTGAVGEGIHFFPYLNDGGLLNPADNFASGIGTGKNTFFGYPPTFSNGLRITGGSPQIDATTLANALNVVGSSSVNGNIVLQPGNVALNSSVVIEAPRLDQPTLILKDASGTTTSSGIELRDFGNTPYFKVIGGTDAFAAGTLVSKTHVSYAHNTFELGTDVNVWKKAFVTDLDIGGFVDQTGIAAPALSAAGRARVYFDSGTNKLRLSANGGAYADVSGGTPPFVDTTAIVKGSVTDTKLLRLEVDGWTAPTTRVWTAQDTDLTVAGINVAQTWTATQTMRTILMGTDLTYDIGAAGVRVRDIYSDRVREISEIIVGPVAGLNITGIIRPDANNTRENGTSTRLWSKIWTQDLHIGGTVQAGTYTGDILPINDSTNAIGSSGARWQTGNFNVVEVGKSAVTTGIINVHHASTAGTAAIQGGNTTGSVDLEVTRPMYPSANSSFSQGLATRRYDFMYADNYNIANACTMAAVTGAPSGACTTCHTRVRTDGGTGSTFYVCEATVWVPK
jgi:hypothetical protein